MTEAAATATPSSGPRTLGAALRVFARDASPRFLIAVVALSLGVRIALGGWSIWDAVTAAAIVGFWPVLEWLIHVCILHAKPLRMRGRTLDLAVPRKHRAHHRDPWNLEILFIPIQGFAVSLPLLMLLCAATLPSLALGLTVLTVVFSMALQYEWVHFLIHTPYRPRSRLYERLWRNHRLHHCKNEHYWYGVTMLGGDRLFGTAPPYPSVATSPTCRTLEWAAPAAPIE
jgi:hypothetical protein